MLILSRNTGQQIRIGDEVVVKVLEVNGQQVKIGIEAPKTISVDREEIYQRKKLAAVKTCANEPIQSASTIKKAPLIIYK